MEISKIGKFWNYSFVRYSAPLVISPILIFAIYKLIPTLYSLDFHFLFPMSQVEGGGQNFERLNVERPIFRNFKIANIEITKDELFRVLLF